MPTQAVILDCYTDEPSGYGVPPFVGTHQLHLSQALAFRGVPHHYLTIDDLRYERLAPAASADGDTDIRILNTTHNRDRAQALLHDADVIYIIMGCFVDYAYFSAAPPQSQEVFDLIRHTRAKKVLFYVMGTLDGISPDYLQSPLHGIIDHVEHGNTYRAVLENTWSTAANNLIAPNYPLLRQISSVPAPLLEQIRLTPIVEIETGTGCNTPTCSFCIESERSPRVTYRTPDDIAGQIATFYGQGARHFRLGRQPNFFHYQRQDLVQLERMLAGIRTRCPDLRTLHIDNVNIVNVVSPPGRDFARLVVQYCTSGNVAPFGIESFDDDVRRATRVAGTAAEVMRAIEIINEVGAARGEDGQPRLLPGINIIYNLPGQTPRTHEINLRHLQAILDRGLMTRRLYYRNMTQPTGASFGTYPVANEEFRNNFREMTERFVLPMQTRVFPPGTRITADWEHLRRDGRWHTRALGTGSIKMVLDTAGREPPRSGPLEVTGNLGYRVVSARLPAAT